MPRSDLTFISQPVTRRDFVKKGALALGSLGVGSIFVEGLLAGCGDNTSTAASGITAGSSATTTAAGAGSPTTKAAATGPLQDVNWRLGWLAGGQQAGEYLALDRGYYKSAGINLTVQPGGPNLDSISLVANNSAMIGQTSSSPALILAVGSGIPVKAFASALQKHPFAYFSLKDKNITSPKDFIGKRIGIQGTSRPLIDALLAKNNIPTDQVKIQVIGGDLLPLVNGQVDVASAWVIDQAQAKALPPNGYNVLLLWDTGIQLYANPYFAKEETITKNPQLLASFLDATARGWDEAFADPEAAIAAVMKNVQGLDKDIEVKTVKSMVDFSYNQATKENGWGWMDMAIWQNNIDTYTQLNLLKKPLKAADAASLDILKLTPNRPKK